MSWVTVDVTMPEKFLNHLESVAKSISNPPRSKLEQKMRPLMDEWVSYARTYHRYQNRTFAAHRSLMADLDVYRNLTIAYLGYGKIAPHGVYLELKRVYHGKYKILEEAVHSNIRALLRSFGDSLIGMLYEFEWQ